ncbi:DUF3857 domain-containing protein [Epilithonimonas sp.]|uniref:DUF3857 domain-containing protein n=1 Tax=Epilithonimonas sp. TaxID=2894511 RepID=UPI0035AFF39E
MKKLMTVIVMVSAKMLSQNYAISDIPEDLKKDANAVVRNYSAQHLIKAADNMEVKNISVISILNKAADNFSYVYIPYDKNTRISDVKIRVLDEFGKPLKTYSKGDLNDIAQSNDSYLYTDDRAFAMKIIQPVYPYTIEIAYLQKTSDTAFLPVLQPFRSANVSVQSWSEEFINESGINLRKKITEGQFGKAEVGENGNHISVSYRNIPALKAEKYAPSPETIFSKAEFALDKACLKGKCGDFSTWKDFAKWYNNLLGEVSVVTPEIQREVDALNLTGSKAEKVKKIYQYMQGKTRYVFVGIGIGGWQPMVADEVRKKAYGDCKALTNYMRVLLKAAGIPSYYSVIYSDFTPRLFDQKFPRMDGNHIILCVPTENGDIWLENTSQNIAFNHLSYNTRDRNVVMVSDDDAKIVNTPVYKAEDSKEELHLKAQISEDASLKGTSQLLYTGGMYDSQLGKVTMSPQEFKESLKDDFNSLNFSKVDYSNLKNDRDNATLTYDVSFEASNFSKTLGNDIYFRALPVSYLGFYLDSSEQRKLPVEVSFGYNNDYDIEYTIPKNYKFTEIPLNKKIDSEFGNYTISFSQKDDKITIKRTFKINKGIIPLEKIADYISFRKQINKTDATKILITKL